MADWGLPAAAPAQDDGAWAPDTNFRSSPTKAKEDVNDGGFDNQDNGDGGDHDNQQNGGDGEERLCFNCNQPGHQKSECTNEPVEREFTGECRICAQSGHRAKDCPEKPPSVCKICGEEGHVGSDCTSNRILGKIEATDPDTAWDNLVKADGEKDVDMFKDCMLLYCKAVPEMTFSDLEAAFRENDMQTHLVAMEKEISVTHTLVNLQGKAAQKYLITFQTSSKPRRARQQTGWPETPEENAERLKEAGFLLASAALVCTRCLTEGHSSSKCPEKGEGPAAQPSIECANCGGGHRARDCTEPRRGEKKEPECRNCGQTGHISKECTEEKNMDNVKCKNCDSMGHFSKECPLPTDWSRVQCTNCQEFGHSYKRCKAEPAQAADDGGDGGW